MGCRSSVYLCICCICCLLFFAAPIVIPITLSYVGLKPRFYIQQLYIPALNSSIMSINASNLNNSIFIDLKFKRVVAYVPLRYEDINITLFYGSNRSFSVANCVIPGFYQGKKKTVHRRAAGEARGLQEISGGPTVALTVEVATKYKLKRYDEDGNSYYENPKAVVVAAEVRLDASGNKVSSNPLRLH